jgi:hypothetical protein
MIARSELSVILLFKRVQYHSPVHGRPVTAIAGNDASARPRSRRKRVLPRALVSATADYRLLGFGVFLSGALLATALLSDARAGGGPTVARSRSIRTSDIESFWLELSSSAVSILGGKLHSFRAARVRIGRPSTSNHFALESSKASSAASSSVLTPHAEGMFVRRSSEMRSR